MKKANWSGAIKISKKAKDKSIYNFIQWRHLLTKGNKASFYDYLNFIKTNEDYPRIGRIESTYFQTLNTGETQFGWGVYSYMKNSISEKLHKSGIQRF